MALDQSSLGKAPLALGDLGAGKEIRAAPVQVEMYLEPSAERPEYTSEHVRVVTQVRPPTRYKGWLT